MEERRANLGKGSSSSQSHYDPGPSHLRLGLGPPSSRGGDRASRTSANLASGHSCLCRLCRPDPLPAHTSPDLAGGHRSLSGGGCQLCNECRHVCFDINMRHSNFWTLATAMIWAQIASCARVPCDSHVVNRHMHTASAFTGSCVRSLCATLEQHTVSHSSDDTCLVFSASGGGSPWRKVEGFLRKNGLATTTCAMSRELNVNCGCLAKCDCFLPSSGRTRYESLSRDGRSEKKRPQRRRTPKTRQDIKKGKHRREHSKSYARDSNDDDHFND